MIRIGINTQLPTDVECYEGVNLHIGNYCSIGARFKIYSGLHPIIENPGIVSQFPFAEHFKVAYPTSKMDGEVYIHHDVWIATDVSILAGITIGSGSIIGAGSVVTKNVQPYSFVAGNPAVVKNRRYTEEIRTKLMRIKWWDWPEEKIRACIEEFNDINLFVQTYG